MSGLQLTGHGKYIPKKKVTNDDFSLLVDTSDEWIRKRTGIRKRYFTDEGEDLVMMGAAAAEAAISAAGIEKEEIGLIVSATTTHSLCYPSLSCMIMERLGIPGDIPAFDVSAACTGFIYALETAHALSGKYCDKRRFMLVVGAEENSEILDFTDRGSCILFGDGAGAVVARPSDTHRFFSHTGATGESAPLEASFHKKVQMDGRRIFNFAVDIIPEEIRRLESMSGVCAADIDYIVCHQANIRIIENVARRLGLSFDKFFHNLEKYGNLSGASIPVALEEMWAAGMLKPKTRIFLVGFGAGLTGGGAYLEY